MLLIGDIISPVSPSILGMISQSRWRLHSPLVRTKCRRFVQGMHSKYCWTCTGTLDDGQRHYLGDHCRCPIQSYRRRDWIVRICNRFISGRICAIICDCWDQSYANLGRTGSLATHHGMCHDRDVLVSNLGRWNVDAEDDEDANSLRGWSH